MVDSKKETIHAFLYTALSKIVTYVLVFVFANYYISEEYGLGNLAFNIRNIVIIATSIGLVDGLVPFIVMKKKINSILKSLVFINLLFTIIGLIASIKYPIFLPFALTLPFSLLSSISLAFWRAKSRYGFANFAGLFGVILILIFAFFFSSLGSLGLTLSYSLGYLLASILVFYPIRKELFNSLKGKFKFEDTKDYLKQGLAITFISNLFLLISSIDSAILGIPGDFRLIAEFAIASAISGIISMIPLTLALFMITRASQIKNKQKSLDIFHRITRISFFTSISAAILLVIFTPLILKLFFPLYENIGVYILTLSLGMVFFSSYYIIYSYYIGKIQSQRAVLPVLVGLIINIALSLIFVSQYGIIAICIANALAHLVTLLLMAKNEKMKRVVFMSSFSIILIPLVYFIGYWGILIFLVLMPLSILFKIITLEDIRVLKEAILNQNIIKSK